MTSTQWTRENLAWIAGIVEGEGSIRWTEPRPKQDGRWPGGQTLDVSVGMTDEDIIRRLARLAGIGNVFGPYKGTNKPRWLYKACGTQAYALLVAILPWLGKRRKEQTLAAIKSWLASHPKRAFNAAQVATIRHQVANGPRGTASRLAREYGVSVGTISNVVKGRMYKWANGPIAD